MVLPSTKLIYLKLRCKYYTLFLSHNAITTLTSALLFCIICIVSLMKPVNVLI